MQLVIAIYSPREISRSAIADKLRCRVGNLWQKYKCKKHASNVALQSKRHFEMLNR